MAWLTLLDMATFQYVSRRNITSLGTLIRASATQTVVVAFEMKAYTSRGSPVA